MVVWCSFELEEEWGKGLGMCALEPPNDLALKKKARVKGLVISVIVSQTLTNNKDSCQVTVR